MIKITNLKETENIRPLMLKAYISKKIVSLDLFNNLILKIIDTTNQSNTQTKFFSFISITRR
jgi:hypothetical protein